VTICRQKLEKEPGNVPSLFQLGSALFNLGQRQESIDTMQKVLAIAPNRKEQAEPFIEQARAKLKVKGEPQPSPAR